LKAQELIRLGSLLIEDHAITTIDVHPREKMIICGLDDCSAVIKYSKSSQDLLVFKEISRFKTDFSEVDGYQVS
jgi:hypothetical protein